MVLSFPRRGSRPITSANADAPENTIGMSDTVLIFLSDEFGL